MVGEGQTPGGGMERAVEVQGCLTHLIHHPVRHRRTLRGRNDGGGRVVMVRVCLPQRDETRFFFLWEMISVYLPLTTGTQRL